MTPHNLKKTLFILFDQKLLDDVAKIYLKYEYMIEDNDVKIINLISKIYTTTDQTKIIEYLNELGSFPPSDIFPDIKSLQCKLALNCNDAGILEYSRMITLFKKSDLDKIYSEDPVVYLSPAYTRISVNGKEYDEQLDYVSRCQNYLGDKNIFRSTIDKITRAGYKNYLKVRHSLETKDYDYGFKAVQNLIDLYFIEKMNMKVNKDNFRELLSDYVIIIDFMSAFQVLGYKFTNTVEYHNLKKMFENIILSLSVSSLLIMETTNENVLKDIAQTKKNLKENHGYTDEELNDYLKPIIERIKDGNQ